MVLLQMQREIIIVNKFYIMNYTFFLIFWSFTLFSQENLIDSSNENETYKVINSLFSKNENENIVLSNCFLNYKGWANYFYNYDFFDSLYGHCIDEENKKILSLKDIMNENEITLLNSEVGKIKPQEKIDENLLTEKIGLISNFKEVNEKSTIIYISKPIILKNKAILYFRTDNEEKIIVLRREVDGWNVLCNKFLFLRTQN